VFIGKPCDVAGLTKAQRIRSGLAKNVGVTIAFFCAGTPSTRGTLDMLHRMGVDDPDSVADVRYRGHGWPGAAAVTVRKGNGFETRRLSYEESWGGILTNHKQWRCQVCADHTGELADISVGDPWYRTIAPDDPGQSLVLVRTERGRRVLRDAVTAGYLKLTKADPSILPDSQAALLRGRGAVWGRSLACRVLGVPAPRYKGFPLLRWWWSELSVRQKVRTFGGTVKRVLRGEFSQDRLPDTHESPGSPDADGCVLAADGGLPVRATPEPETVERRKAA
jgi:coenzyme F420 hydrogenase subunit beta